MLGTSPIALFRTSAQQRGASGTDHTSMIAPAQANFRRTNVATKLKITYLREQYLNVKVQYKACA